MLVNQSLHGVFGSIPWFLERASSPIEVPSPFGPKSALQSADVSAGDLDGGLEGAQKSRLDQGRHDHGRWYCFGI